MKNKYKIYLSIGITLIMLIISLYYYYFVSDHETKKIIKIKGCKVEFYYSFNDFYNKNKKNGGHGPSNVANECNAKSEICICLLSKYKTTIDDSVKSFILNHYHSKPLGLAFYESHYLKCVFVDNPPIDSLVKYKVKLFADKLEIMNLINNYLVTKDEKIRKEILNNYNFSNAQNTYCEIIQNNKLIKNALENPDFEMLYCYKDEIFSNLYELFD